MPWVISCAVTSIERATTLECDVCVIGSGAGGSVVAAELAAANKRVIVLEAGSGQQAPDFDQREFVGMQHLYLDQGLISSRDLGVAILAGATLGGFRECRTPAPVLGPLDAAPASRSRRCATGPGEPICGAFPAARFPVSPSASSATSRRRG